MKENDLFGYYLDRDGQVTGPFTVCQLRHLWQTGQATLNDRVCLERTEDWTPIRTHRAILETAGAQDAYRHLIYVLLSIFGGPAGINNAFAAQYGRLAVKITALVAVAFLWPFYPRAPFIALAVLWLTSLIESISRPVSRLSAP